MKRLIIVGIALGLLATACGSKGAVSIGTVDKGGGGSPTSPTPSRPHSPKPSPSSSPTIGRTVTVEVWFQRGEQLFMIRRTLPSTVAVGGAAMTELLSGPTQAERTAGLGTSVPSGTRLRGLNITNGIATIDLTGTYASGGGSLSMQMRVAQVVFTLTQFGTIHGVKFALDGKPVNAIGGEGIVVALPQTRKTWDGLLPLIVVESPGIGQRVGNPVTISGTANVFEATVSVRILDQHGNEVGRAFTTATCGTGCRGVYSVQVKYSVQSEQPGTIEVYQASAQDGSPTDLVSIPVTLTP
jgi:germination protein M